MSFVAIDVRAFAAPAPRDHGAVSQLMWIAIDKLMVDRAYQRDLTASSRKRILDIAAAFDWSCFSPVIVAPVAGGSYAIIDGQHRTHAALLVGERQVPCMVVIADRERQAKSFAAINGAVLKMAPGIVFRAALAAREPEVVALDRLARECGVRILTYPCAAARQKRGDTMAAGAIRNLNRRHGAEVMRRVFTALMASKGDLRGAIAPEVVAGLCLLFQAKPLALETIGKAFAHLDIGEIRAFARREGGGFSAAEDFRAEVAKRLARLAGGHGA